MVDDLHQGLAYVFDYVLMSMRIGEYNVLEDEHAWEHDWGVGVVEGLQGDRLDVCYILSVDFVKVIQD